MQTEDGNAQGGAGGLAGGRKRETHRELMDQMQWDGGNYSSYFTKLGKHWRKEPKFHSKAEVELSKFQMLQVALSKPWQLGFVTLLG